MKVVKKIILEDAGKTDCAFLIYEDSDLVGLLDPQDRFGTGKWTSQARVQFTKLGYQRSKDVVLSSAKDFLDIVLIAMYRMNDWQTV